MFKNRSVNEIGTFVSWIAFIVLSMLVLILSRVNHAAEVVAFTAWMASMVSIAGFTSALISE